jgi:hypothetical protein
LRCLLLPVVSETIGIFYALEKIENYDILFSINKEEELSSNNLSNNKKEIYRKRKTISEEVEIVSNKKSMRKISQRLSMISVKFPYESNISLENKNRNSNLNEELVSNEYTSLEKVNRIETNTTISPKKNLSIKEIGFNDILKEDENDDSVELETDYYLEDFVNLYKLFYLEENWKIKISLAENFPNLINKCCKFHSIRQNVRRRMFKLDEDNKLEAIMEYKKFKSLICELFEHFIILLSDPLSKVREVAFNSLLPSLNVFIDDLNFEDAELLDENQLKLHTIISKKLLATFNNLILHGETSIEVRGKKYFI